MSILHPGGRYGNIAFNLREVPVRGKFLCCFDQDQMDATRAANAAEDLFIGTSDLEI